MAGARDYTQSTLKKLFTLSGNKCACPNCDRAVIARDGISIAGKICHIEAASSDGPRYNPSMTDDDRRHFNNLILMCDECHTIIDNKANEDKYTKELLHSWKKEHESILLYKKATKSSDLITAIEALSEIELEEDILDDRYNSYNVTEKILFNGLNRNRDIVEEYKVFFPSINLLYNELDREGSFKKEKLLNVIRNIYLRVKRQYSEVLGNADNIFEDIENEIFSIVSKTTNSDDISLGISIIMVDAFIRCKILEEPK